MKTEKINAINNLHKYINCVMPIIINKLSNSEIKFNNDGNLQKTNRDKLLKILNDNNNYKEYNNYTCIRSWLDFKYNCKYICFDICYKNVDSKGNYLNSSYYKKSKVIFHLENEKKHELINNFTKLPIFTEKQVKNAVIELNELNNKINELKKHTSKIESMFLFQI